MEASHNLFLMKVLGMCEVEGGRGACGRTRKRVRTGLGKVTLAGLQNHPECKEIRHAQHCAGEAVNDISMVDLS